MDIPEMNMPTAQEGWFDTILKKLKLDQLNINTDRLMQLGMYFGFGFVAGFLLKRFANYVVVALLTILALVLLHQFGVITITIDPIKMKEVFGIEQTVTIDTNIFAIYWEWIKLNATLVISFVIGAVVGLKLG